MIQNSPEFERLAERLADGEPVDWPEEVADARDEPTLRSLRRLQAIQAAYHESSEDHDRLPMARSPETTATGEGPLFTWGSLQVLREIGRGSTGRVFLAHDPKLDRPVALKLFEGASVDQDALEEARRLARVRHEHLLTVHGADEHDGVPGLWTEFVVGLDLEDELRLRGPWTGEQAVDAGLALCGVLGALHGEDITHGDVKARNVLRERGGRLVLVDLGSGSDHRGEVDTVRTGTPFVMAPEVLAGAPPRAEDDLYALGVLLYRMLGEAYPVEAESLEQLRRAHAERGPVPVRERRPDLPSELAAVVDRALARRREDRFASAEEMASALRVCRPSRPTIGRPVLTFVLVCLLALVAFGGWWWTRPGAPVVAVDAPPATLYRNAGGTPDAVAPMGEVRVGDRLHLDVTLEQPAHLYVLNEDATGAVVVLFPGPTYDLTNPLPASEHRLPGPIDGESYGWQVSSAGGEEHILLVRSPAAVEVLESAIAELPGASPEMAVNLPSVLDPEDLRRLRGVAGLAPSEPAGRTGSGYLRALVDDLRARGDGEVSLRLFRFRSVR